VAGLDLQRSARRHHNLTSTHIMNSFRLKGNRGRMPAITVTMAIVNLPSATTQLGSYAYLQNQDGSGSMTFDWQGLTDSGIPITASMKSQWLGSGAGRADLTADLTPNLPNQSTTLGTDCWGVDTVASYSYRRQGNTTTGARASCLF